VTPLATDLGRVLAAIAEGSLDEGDVNASGSKLTAQVRGYRLTEVRKAQGATQQSVSALMGSPGRGSPASSAVSFRRPR
jgi:hypothetical protein